MVVQQIKEIDINDDLIGWIQSFLTNRLMEFVIDGFTNLMQKVELGIAQSSPVFSILFLIYICRVFFMIEKQLSHVTFVSFIDNLGFLTAKWFLSKIAKRLVKVRQIILEWGASNIVIFNTSKIEAFFFSKACRQKLAKLLETRLRIGQQTIYFRKKTSR